MLGMLVLAIDDLDVLLRTADVTAAMSVEALMGTDRAFAADLMALRPHAGQTTSAANLRILLEGSAIVASHRHDPRVQDAYSLRCTPSPWRPATPRPRRSPQPKSSCARRSTTPPCCPTAAPSRADTSTVRGGVAMRFLAIACAEVSSIAERRTDRLLDRSRSHGLPPFLVEDAGVNSGLMIVQYTQAAMVAENRRLAAPASVDSIPTSAMQDHVSMGWSAARKLRRSVSNLGRISPASSSARLGDSTALHFGRRRQPPRRSLPSVTPAWPATARTAGRPSSWPSPKHW